MAKEQNKVAAAVTENTPPLEINATVRLIEPKNNLLGFANVTFNGAVTVTDFKVLRAEDGELYVGMPSKLGGNGKYSPTTWVKGDENKQQLTGAVLTEYHAAVEKLKARAAAIGAESPAPIKEQMAKAGKEAAEHNAKLPAPSKGKEKNAEI